MPRPAQVKCSRCGGPPAPGTREFTVAFEDDPPCHDHDFCPECGRRVVFHIEFDKGG